MYRIAVIQNEIEMQHSGYADAAINLEKHKKEFKYLTTEKLCFTRFTSINVADLFKEGENYLLDYDCLILATNATSDEDVYNILKKEPNKKLLEEYISRGKGLLICSQKKYQELKELEQVTHLYKPRKSWFLPIDYEYKVISRPKNEDSNQGCINIVEQEQSNIPKFLYTFPQCIQNQDITNRCEGQNNKQNDFQKHYYRDYIIPLNDSSYYPVLADTTKQPQRNILMVARPKTKEKIVISTMALDWVGHYEIIENILYYLLIGLPSVAFVDKTGKYSKEFQFIIDEAKSGRVPYYSYDSLEDLEKNTNNLRQYHRLYVFSPSFSEDEVLDFWNKYKNSDRPIKICHCKKEGNEKELVTFVLVNYSQLSYIEKQKKEVEAYLRREYTGKLCGKSFWKTFDVIFALYNINKSIPRHYLSRTFEVIKEHCEKDGSYDGVLASTCGLLELEDLGLELLPESPEIQKLYNQTKQNLVKRYKDYCKDEGSFSSNYNKKFIIRSFYKTKKDGNKQTWDDFTESVALTRQKMQSIAVKGEEENYTGKANKRTEIDLCLDIEILLIFIKEFGGDKIEQTIYDKIINRVEQVLEGQQDNGLWDNNLGKTARLLVFFLLNDLEPILKLLLKEKEEARIKKVKEIKEGIDKMFSLGISALRHSYDKDNFNWEGKVVTTANAITAIILYDNIKLGDKSKDFLNQLNIEARSADSYNSLDLAFDTINDLTKKNTESEKQLADYKNKYKKDLSCDKFLLILNAILLVILLCIPLIKPVKDLIIKPIKDLMDKDSSYGNYIVALVMFVVGMIVAWLIGLSKKYFKDLNERRKL